MANTITDLPPYGYTLADNKEFLEGAPLPRGFRRNPNVAASGGHANWTAWVEGLAADMAQFLWPMWGPTGWYGGAEDGARALTLADLDLLQDIQAHEAKEPILGNGGIAVPQLVAFRDEDDKPPFRTIDNYKHTMPVTLRQDIAANIVIGGRDIARVLSQELKSRFQRPRPAQVAQFWQRPTEVVVQRSVSAVTPAMIAGHPVQGCIAFGQVLFAMQAEIAAVPGLEDVLGRFLIDTGDRRVYAGLHYPSDMLGSWYAALSLCDHVFGTQGPDIRRRLWTVVQRSAVYKAMLERGGPAYVPLRTKLANRAAQGFQETAW